MELLLLSNSTNFGETMYSHAADAFHQVAQGARVVFIPFALADWDDYADRAIAAMGAFGIESSSAHRAASPDRAILEADVVMMGGGNTFRLLDSLYRLNVVEALNQRVRLGETRDTRIEEFLEDNDCPVLAMYEGTWLRISNERAMVTGPARLFRREGCEALDGGVDISQLLRFSPTFDDGRRPSPGGYLGRDREAAAPSE
jgi:peptidase E